MIYHNFTYSFPELSIRSSTFEELNGYQKGTAPEPIPMLINELLDEAKDLIAIQGGYTIFDDIEVDSLRNTLKLPGIEFNIKNIILKQLKNSEKIIFIICTAGPKITEYATKLCNEGDIMKSYFADMLGNIAVDAAIARFQMEFTNQTSLQGIQISNIYNPGHCGWEVSEQQKLFSLFPPKFCGIELTTSSLMNPMKSISGMMGMGKDLLDSANICDLCGIKNCNYRKKTVIM